MSPQGYYCHNSRLSERMLVAKLQSVFFDFTKWSVFMYDYYALFLFLEKVMMYDMRGIDICDKHMHKGERDRERVTRGEAKPS